MEAATPKIYKAITDVMRKTNAISKGRKNQQQGFQFRGIDDVMNELHGTLAECGVFVVPEVLEETRTEGKTKTGASMNYTRLKIRFGFYADDGSHVDSTVIGEAMDSGDKASNKALSIGFKYACLQVFCIPTEDDKDPDAQSHEMSVGAQNERAQYKKQQIAQKSTPQLGPKPAGGPDTPEQHAKIAELFRAQYLDGTYMFSQAEVDKFAKMRTTMPANGLITLLQETIKDRMNSWVREHGEPESSAPSVPEEVWAEKPTETDPIF